MAFYSGDDTKGEYVYKFVPNGRFVAGADADNRRLLDDGTLYVARFDADGSGQWLALVHGKHGLTTENGFPSQPEVLLNARAAADRAGATPMDRPEWVAVHPDSREVYVTLTNNDGRGAKQPLDKANPRPNNLHGQILRWNEEGADPTATRFQWEVFLLAGEQRGARDGQGNAVAANLIGTIDGDRFSSPDGLAFDRDGRLWIETDFDDDQPAMQAMGTNQLLCADPKTREVRHHLEPGLPRHVDQRAAPRAELPGQRRPVTPAFIHDADHQERWWGDRQLTVASANWAEAKRPLPSWAGSCTTCCRACTCAA